MSPFQSSHAQFCSTIVGNEASVKQVVGIGVLMDRANVNQEHEWLNAVDDTELRRELGFSASANDFTGVIRTAFVHLERRIRESAGLDDRHYGKDLIDKAFNPKDGILQPVSPDGAERTGLYNLLLGIFLYYRNPIAHRPVYHSPESAIQVLSLIDHALRLVRQAVELSFNLNNIVGAHEGQIWRRQDYRLDIDGDGILEVVVLLELGPVMDGEELVPHLLPVILQKGDKGYRRIPAEWVKGISLYGPTGVTLHHVTNPNEPDVVVSWTFGNSQNLVLILSRQSERYALVKREIPPGMKNPYSGPAEKGFLVHSRQTLYFADVDGDGLDEVVQTLSFDPDDMQVMGYPQRLEDDQERFLVSRLWKWDVEKRLIVQVREGLVVERFSSPHHLE